MPTHLAGHAAFTNASPEPSGPPHSYVALTTTLLVEEAGGLYLIMDLGRMSSLRGKILETCSGTLVSRSRFIVFRGYCEPRILLD